MSIYSLITDETLCLEKQASALSDALTLLLEEAEKRVELEHGSRILQDLPHLEMSSTQVSILIKHPSRKFSVHVSSML
jgi:hypothetical protein